MLQRNGNRRFLSLAAVFLAPLHLSAWTDGQLLIWMDSERVPGVLQMGRFFSAVGRALQVATEGKASAQEALRRAALSMRGE